ncbi:MAG: LPS assembly protein LptD [Myxococcaceae bacterium]|nr:LPS assembly protein LptD [Myxococcaceae bacterium]
MPVYPLLLLALAQVPLSLTAERVVHENTRQLTLAEGHARLTSEGAAMTAERIHYDGQNQAATAVGGVIFRAVKGGALLVLADVVTVRFVGGEVDEVFIQDGYGLRKTVADPLRFLAEDSLEALEAMGPTTLRVSGNHLKRTESGWRVDALNLTPCDCTASSATWRVHASSAVVNLEGDRVSAWGPTIYVGDIPLLWFPWLSLPLSDRQTGLLVPKPDYGPLNGFSLELPVFVTLGRSADLTLTPGFFTGGKDVNGVRGPRLLSEFRYRPSLTTEGRLTFGALYDFRFQRDPVRENIVSSNIRGFRFDASVQHRQSWSGGWGTRIDGSVVSDGYLVRDVTADVLAREAGYLRSNASLFRRTDNLYAQVEVTVRQDLSWGYGLWSTPYVASGSPAFGPNPLQRLPALTVAMPERPIGGPFSFSVWSEVTRLAPLDGLTGDEGPGAFEGFGTDDPSLVLSTECLSQRLYAPTPSSALCPAGFDVSFGKAGQGDRRYQPGEREARDRLTLFPKLTARGQAGPFLSGFASAGWRQSAWAGEASGRFGQRGYPVLAAGLETALSKRFGEAADAVSHRLAPMVEVRSVPLQVGQRPAPDDEIDTAAGTQPRAFQGVVALRQRLTRLSNEQSVLLLAFDLGQEADLLEGRVGEAFARLSSEWGVLRGTVAARFDINRARLTQISTRADVDLAKGRGFWAGYDNLANEGTGQTARAFDLLFGLPLQGTQRTQLLSAGARWQWRSLAVRYEMLWLTREFTQPTALPRQALALAQHSAAVSWAPSCDCWRVEVAATQRIDENVKNVATYGFPQLSASLTVTGFGTFGR